MIEELRGQTKGSVINFLTALGQNSELYSNTSKGLEPILQDHEVYLFANLNEVLVVVLDPRPSDSVELADEEPFSNDEQQPLWFTERSHRVSPVWRLAVTIELFRGRIRRLSKHGPKIQGVLLTGCEVINFDDMQDIWKKLNVSVFDHISGLQQLSFPVNSDLGLPVASAMSFVFDGDYDDKDIKEAEKKLRQEMENAYEKTNTLFSYIDDDEFELDHVIVDFDEDDDDDYDMNDDEQQSFEARLKKVIHDARQKNRTMMNKVSSITLNVSTGCRCQPSLYTDGSFIVTLIAERGSYLRLDFKCYVYTKDWYAMCNSVQGAEVKRSKGSRLTIDMRSFSIWLPGSYFLLLFDDCDRVQRIDFTLDDKLCATVGERSDCLPCSLEHILVSCVENKIEKWTQLALFPGGAQFRKWILKRIQLEAYNKYRNSLHAQMIGSNSNLLICKRNDDINERFLRMMYDMSAIKNHSFKFVDCSQLYDTSHPTNPYETLNDEFSSGSNLVLCLTNLGTMLNAGGKVIARKVLGLMTDKSKGNILWVCGTRQEVDALLNMYPSFGRLFLKKNSCLEQELYSGFDIVQCFRRRLMKEFLHFSDEVRDAFARAIIKGCATQTLCSWSLENINRHVVEEVRPKYLKRALSNILSEELTELSVDDLCLDRLTTGSSSFDECMRKLNMLVGLDSVKKGLQATANNARLLIERRRQGLRTSEDLTYHCVFTGNPGTGKTTIARMLGKIFHSLGLLSIGDIVEVDRTRLVGQYIGQTEENMKQILEAARGNVLFIDEAYTLFVDNDDRKDFGFRVLDSLMTVLTQPNPDMLIVLAGYPKEMEALLDANPGLSSRFPFRYQFPDYTSEQLMEIARQLLSSDDYIMSSEAEATLMKLVEETLRKNPKNFGNGRWIHHIVHQGIVPALANRVFAAGSNDFQHIEAVDVRMAYENMTSKSMVEKQKPCHKRVVGFCSVLFAVVMFFCGCQQKKEINYQEEVQTEMSRSASDSHVAILDSMLTYLNVDADPASKASYEWKWAKQTRFDLGIEEEPVNLDRLDALSFDVDKIYAPLTASSPSEANDAAGVFAATACFRLLNAYQILADQLCESLDENWFLQDFSLWRGVYSEFEESHINAFGRNTSYMLSMAQKTFYELRHTMLIEEIGYFDVEREGAAEWYIEVNEIRWKPKQKAIRLWYDHRMKMADKLKNTNLAEYIRHMTYKTVFIYQHLQLEWQYDFENS